ncbi:ECF subfamily RNA polymerase sigma-24 subunit [Cellulomonas carbonis T26]|uniref:ECF subfamily RNA polymerase sigma-24 subunit n=1 Tax=Cellulomonas carbonis T26 TaxID=947969 RepID=A0A0A0BUB9_9CELL|nr:ECF subfamily RNA polymerase sigma-24 subunit [Cellulomonas carbonis T26]
MPEGAEAALVRAFADEWASVVATLIRTTGDWALAEDATQDAFVAAARRWPVDGVPSRPGAWLTTVARNAARDRLRRGATEDRVLRRLAADPTHAPADDDALTGDVALTGERPDPHATVPDDRLRLIFTCCHPALPPDARVALTLRTLCGLTVPEIARAFGASEPAMAKRLVRARQKIAHARIPYRVPAPEDVAERLDGVLTVVYLVFTEGYAATAGSSALRVDLCLEAIRLARLLTRLVPQESEAHALLALVLLHDARRPGRLGRGGVLVPLDEQDRSAWDAGTVEEGLRALVRAQRLAVDDAPYLLQAEIAACHSTAPTPAATDWATVVALYDRLLAVAPSPHARLARAVAVGSAAGPAAGLTALGALAADDVLRGTAVLAATEADLLRRAGRSAEAAAAYRTALALAGTDDERAFFRRRLEEASHTA